eukprot:247334_1
MKQNIQVIVRVRPPVEEEKKLCVEVNNHNQICISDNNTINNFNFDYVAGMNTKQIEMMELVGKQVTDKCLKGYTATIFAYGQTGSGKTYTMQGEYPPQSNMGLMPNIFAYLYNQFKHKSENENVEYCVKAQCLEIYNENINDLFNIKQRNLRLREDAKNRSFYVQNLTQKPCKSAEDCLRFVQEATKNRKTFGTKMNIHSSRSHLLFTLLITRRKMVNSINPKESIKSRTCRLNLVDLAGSERQNKTNTTGDRLKEAKHINKSLSTLGRVIQKIIQNDKHIPFRDSKITQLLKNSIGGNSLTYMIANISPSYIHSNETLSTLRFANSVKQIKNKAKINEDKHCNLEALKAENSRFVCILEELTKKYEESQQKNNKLNKQNTELVSENNELKFTVNKLTFQKELTTQKLKNKENKIEELESLNNKLTTTVKAQKMQIETLKCEYTSNDNSDNLENENESEIHAECECEPWVVIPNEILSPNTKRKRIDKENSNDVIHKTKKRKINNYNNPLSLITARIMNTNNNFNNISENKMDNKLERVNELSLIEMKQCIDSDENMLYKILAQDEKKLYDIDEKQWTLIENEMEKRLLSNPGIYVYIKKKYNNKFVDKIWKKLKEKKMEMFIGSIFSNKCVRKLTDVQLMEIMDECILKRNQLKELEKERQRRKIQIVEKKIRGAQMYTADIENYAVLMRVKCKEKSERMKIAEKEMSKHEIKILKERGSNLFAMM